jgi:hypothetical protein
MHVVAACAEAALDMIGCDLRGASLSAVEAAGGAD